MNSAFHCSADRNNGFHSFMHPLILTCSAVSLEISDLSLSKEKERKNVWSLYRGRNQGKGRARSRNLYLMASASMRNLLVASWPMPTLIMGTIAPRRRQIGEEMSGTYKIKSHLEEIMRKYIFLPSPKRKMKDS